MLSAVLIPLQAAQDARVSDHALDAIKSVLNPLQLAQERAHAEQTRVSRVAVRNKIGPALNLL